jgi:hypothetical protein
VKKQEMGTVGIGKIKTGADPDIRFHRKKKVFRTSRNRTTGIRTGIKEKRIDFRPVEGRKRI